MTAAPNHTDIPDLLVERFHEAGIYTQDEVWERVEEVMSSMLALVPVDIVPMRTGHRFRRTQDGWERWQ
jgi:hypothetical protein